MSPPDLYTTLVGLLGDESLVQGVEYDAPRPL
jgi:hypothetical protein